MAVAHVAGGGTMSEGKPTFASTILDTTKKMCGVIKDIMEGKYNRAQLVLIRAASEIALEKGITSEEIRS